MKKIIIFLILCVIFLLLCLHPEFFLRNKYSCSKFNIHYSNIQELQNFCDLIETVSENYSRFYSNKNYDIYITSSVFSYKLFSFFSNNLFNINPIRGYAVISPFDMKGMFLSGDVNFKENINEMILRLLLVNKFEKLEYLSFDEWKIKGYSKYISGEIQEYIPSDICNPVNSKKYNDFENMVVVKYLIENKNYNPLNFFADNISYDVYLKETKSIICRN